MTSTRTVLLEVITPREMFYRGQVEMLIVPTLSGLEGFMARHSFCVKLLAPEGVLQIREPGEKTFRKANIKGGHVDIKDTFVVYVDEAQWQ